MVLGMAMQVVVAAKFGATAAVDAYTVGLSIPHLFGDFLTGGMVFLAFVPVFIEYRTRNGEEEAWKIARTVLWILVAALVLATLLYSLFAPFVVSVLAPGLTVETKGLAASLAREMSILLLIFGLVVHTRAIFHSYQNFLVPAVASFLFPAVAIASIVAFSSNMGVHSLALGVVGGGLFHLLAQLVVLTRRKRKYMLGSLDFRHPGVLRVGMLVVPLFWSGLVSQINQLVTRFLASTLEEGSIAALGFANQVITMPLALIGGSVGSAIFPAVSRYAATDNFLHLKETVSKGMRMILFIMVPVVVGLISLRVSIVRLLFERGQFVKKATNLTAEALLYYAVGVVCMAGTLILVRVFYSMQEMKIPLRVSAVGLIVNVAAGLVLKDIIGVGGLALAFSLSAATVFAGLFYFLNRKIRFSERAEMVMVIFKAATASVVMAFVLELAKPHLHLLVSVLVGACVFFLSAILLKTEEMRELKFSLGKIWGR